MAMLLSMRGIAKSFGPVKVLNDVSFELERGQIHALVGHNGAGKSTLIKILGGNFTDYEGQILIDGVERPLHSPRQSLSVGVAIIYQDFSLVPELSVADNIGLGREPRGRLPGLMSHGTLRKRSINEAESLGISLPFDRRISELGVAEQQLTEIVRACSQTPRILVMDEPTARLAPAERGHLFDVMRRMAQSHGIGIIYISHFLEEISQMADRVTVMRDGKVIENGPANRYTVPQLASLLVGQEEAEVIEKIKSRETRSFQPMLEIDAVSVAGRAPVSLSIGSGEIVGLAGLIGSGRTRLARALIGDVPAKGEVRLAGNRVVRPTPQRCAELGLVMVPEDRKISGLALTSSIQANMAATALKRWFSRFGIVRQQAVRETVGSLIKAFGIRPSDPRRAVGTLSGGNAQKVLVARAVAARASVMILDQPTAGVDVGAKAELHRIVEQSASAGAAVLLISDDLDELLTLSQRIVVMVHGSVRSIHDANNLTRAQLLEAISQN